MYSLIYLHFVLFQSVSWEASIMDVTASSTVSNQSAEESTAAASAITKAAMGDSLQEYETQYFGFTPKSFIDGGQFAPSPPICSGLVLSL